MNYQTAQVIDEELVDVQVDYEYQANGNKQEVVLTSIDYWCPDTKTWSSIELDDKLYSRLIATIKNEILWR